MAKKGKSVNYFKARISKRINNLSRAINKIDPALNNKTLAVEYAIKDIKPGINHVSYTRDGVERKIRYDQLSPLSQNEQASLLNKLSVDRYELRQERALEQLKTTGKISKQFKRSLEQQNPNLLQNIKDLEEIIEGNKPETIQDEFSGLDIISGEDFFQEADSFFQSNLGTPELFDFYRPGQSGGFSELNTFTWNAFKIIKGI